MSGRRRTPVVAPVVEPAACSVALRLRILGGLPFFRDLTASDIAELNASFHSRHVAAGEVIYSAGSLADHLYVVATGTVKLLRHTITGQDVLLDILSLGDLFGSLAMLGSDRYLDTAQAQTDCCLLTVSAGKFRAILERYPSVTLSALDFVASRLEGARETVSQLSTAPVEARLASVLLRLAGQLGNDHGGSTLIQIPLSRRDLAEMTGATIESVSRVMSQFRRQGAIESGRQWVAIADSEMLREIAGTVRS